MAWQERGVELSVVMAALCGMIMLHATPVQGQTVTPQTPRSEGGTPQAPASADITPQSPELEDITPQSPELEGVTPPERKRETGTPPTQDAKDRRKPETNIIPSLKVSERYDSNVYFVPGGNLEDYVTSVSPQVRVVHKRQWVEATIGGGVTAEAYVKNPGLNYVAANGEVDLNLDGAMNELVRGLGLHISDTFYYTPQAPSFAAPTGGSAAPDSFVRGIQAARANSRTNLGQVEGTYSASPLVDFISTYRDQRIQFGSVIAAPNGVLSQGSFIDTTFQTVTSGPFVKISPLDTVSLTHIYQKGTFNLPNSTNSNAGFTTQGAAAGWTRSITPTLTAHVQGGVALLSLSNDLQPLAAASLKWKQRDTDVTVSYSRVIAPSFLIVATPLLSQVVSGIVTHRVTELLSLSLNGNYAINQSVPDSSLLKFTSYSVTPSINYAINRTLTATLLYTHSEFQQAFSSQEFRFDKNVVLLSLKAEWK